VTLLPTTRLGTTDLQVSRLCLGGNVFGWTTDEREAFAILDLFAAAGGNFIDTADVYSAWLPGHAGGESETIIGRWMAARGNRGSMIVATKVGMLSGLTGLASGTIRAAVDGSRQRLGVDCIDLYYAHRDDPNTPLAETVRAFDGIVRSGAVRYVAASNYTAPRLSEALTIARREGLTGYVALQPHYNLMHRDEFEGPLRDLCTAEDLACLPYFSLAMGFLTGKYRPGITVESVRAEGAARYLDARGLRTLAVLDDFAAAHSTTLAAVALAWLAAQPAVVAPIASARTPAQLDELLPMGALRLTSAETARLNEASR
jgi:aryl-alcohol dehydrogenase-like predicted oxidoreductase